MTVRLVAVGPCTADEVAQGWCTDAYTEHESWAWKCDPHDDAPPVCSASFPLTRIAITEPPPPPSPPPFLPPPPPPLAPLGVFSLAGGGGAAALVSGGAALVGLLLLLLVLRRSLHLKGAVAVRMSEHDALEELEAVEAEEELEGEPTPNSLDRARWSGAALEAAEAVVAEREAKETEL